MGQLFYHQQKISKKMYRNNILRILAFAFLGISILCFVALTNAFQLVKAADVEPYLQPSEKKLEYGIYCTQAQLDFWAGKLAAEPSSSIYKLKTATLLSEQFKQTGDIDLIHRSDSLLTSVLSLQSIRQAPYYRALSANAITQHQFEEALELAELSLPSALHPEHSHLMRFDALMELGRVEEARSILDSVQTPNFFSQAIRKVKLQDHDGDLDAAILTMEKAAQWCRERQDKALLCWSMSNLGDMYGHAGRIKEAYRAYQDVLQIDPTYWYALKGIAWIAYSEDQNVPLASNILDFIRQEKESPDLLLMLSEMALFEGQKKEAEALEEAFIAAVSRPEYGNMYDRYLAEIYLDRPEELQKAKFYIQKELTNRPLAASYVLWADYMLQRGLSEEAIRLVEEKVVGKTFEPDVLLRVGMIYKAAGFPEEAKSFLDEAAGAEFELGPLTSKEIQNALDEMNTIH
jgi:tetratricopeptide (TPR) repeat protein